MPAVRRLKPDAIFTQDEWSTLRQRSDWMGVGMVLHAWGLIVLAVLLGVWQPWLIPLSIVIIGTRQLGLAILMHEAAHGGLHSNAKVNDWLGQWLCAAPVGASLKSYRPYHLAHHRYTQQPEDPDLVLSAPFPITRASFWRKTLRDLTGQTFLKQRTGQFRAAFGFLPQHLKGNPNISTSAREAVIPFVAMNLVLLGVMSTLGPGWTWPVFWLLPLATWFPFVTRVRNIAEHACVPESSDDPLRQARTTRTRWWEGLLIAPYWVNYHAEHHIFMHLPCYRLRAAHTLLRQKGVTDRMDVEDGYMSVLRLATSAKERAPHAG